jgi:hypothetical protein
MMHSGDRGDGVMIGTELEQTEAGLCSNERLGSWRSLDSLYGGARHVMVSSANVKATANLG